MNRLMIILFIAILTMVGNVQSIAQENIFRELDSLIAIAGDQQRMMGSLTLSREGKIIYQKSWGLGSIENGQKFPVTSASRYRIGSITKMFTAVMILQLKQEGKINLDTPLAHYFPKIPQANKITIEDLLNHQSGLFNYTDDPHYFNHRTQAITQSEMLTMFTSCEPVFQPAEKTEYSNTNYVLLGYILEKITGKTFAENLQQRILKPAGLSATSFEYNGSQQNLVSSFQFLNDWEPLAPTHLSRAAGAGAMISTSQDLARFLETLFDGKLLKPKTLEEMTTINHGFGYGIAKFPFYEKYAFGHSGRIDEFHAVVSYFPEEQLAIAFTGNGQTMNMNDFLLDILSIYFRRPYDLSRYNAVEEYKFLPEELAKFEGLYYSEMVPLKIKLWEENGQLTAQATGQSAFPLKAVNEKEFRCEPFGIVMIFDTSQGPKIQSFTLLQNGAKIVFQKE